MPSGCTKEKVADGGQKELPIVTEVPLFLFAKSFTIVVKEGTFIPNPGEKG
jgi:hypothetical protein